MEVYIQGVIDQCTNIGGWSFVLDYLDGETCQMGCSYETCTASYMTLVAANKALTYLNDNEMKNQTVFTDSKFVFQGITKMVSMWMESDWNTSQGKTIKYQELWQELYDLTQKLNITWSQSTGNEVAMKKAILLSTECSQKSEDI